MSDMALSIVLPAYEEARNLDYLLPALKKVTANFGVASEILVIDAQKPRDDTRDVCERHGVTHIAREGGEFFGDAVRTGIKYAQGRHVIFMDADGSHNPEFLPRLWGQRDAADLVIASRYITGGRTENPLPLIVMSWIVNVIFGLVLGLQCADVSNSLRLYRGEQLRKLNLICNHFDIVEEILVQLVFAQPDFVIKEIPFTFEKRQAGKTKRKLLVFAISYITVLWRLYKIKRRVSKQAYTS